MQHHKGILPGCAAGVLWVFNVTFYPSKPMDYGGFSQTQWFGGVGVVLSIRYNSIQMQAATACDFAHKDLLIVVKQ